MRTKIAVYIYFTVLICEYESGTSSSSISLEDPGFTKDRVGMLIPDVSRATRQKKNNRFKMQQNIRTASNNRDPGIIRDKFNSHVKTMRQPNTELDYERYKFHNTSKVLNYKPKYKRYPHVYSDFNLNMNVSGKNYATTAEFILNGKESKRHKHKLSSLTESPLNITQISDFEPDISQENNKMSDVESTSIAHFYSKKNKLMKTKRDRRKNVSYYNKLNKHNTPSVTRRTTEVTQISSDSELQKAKIKRKHVKPLEDVSDELDTQNMKFFSKIIQAKKKYQNTFKVSLYDKPKKHKEKINRNPNAPQNKMKYDQHNNGHHMHPGSKTDDQITEPSIVPNDKNSKPKISKHSLEITIPVASIDMSIPNELKLIDNSKINKKKVNPFNPRKQLFTLTVSDMEDNKRENKQRPLDISKEFSLSKLLRVNKNDNIKTKSKDSSVSKPELIEIGIIDDLLKNIENGNQKEKNKENAKHKSINNRTRVQPRREVNVNIDKNKPDNYDQFTFKKNFDVPLHLKKKGNMTKNKDQDEILDDDFSKAEILLSDGDKSHNYNIGRSGWYSSSDSSDSSQSSDSDSEDRSRYRSKNRWLSCLGKRANFKCRKACRDAYTDVCRRLKCSSHAKRDLRYECKKRCRRTFHSSNYSTEK